MEILSWLIFTGFVLATTIQLFIWLYYFRRLAVFSKKENPLPSSPPAEIPVSIVICARNEAENLKKNLPLILNQNYRSFETIVINDGSTDQSQNILLKFHIENSNLHPQYVSKKPHERGKKFALAKGIELAKHKVLLMTDADCQPATNEWLSEMQLRIRGPFEIVLGYGPYLKSKGFLNTFIRYEAVYTAVQYLSFALAGHPYMGVGRNLAYKKALFYKAGGFESHQHLMSGDDDLFINAVANKENTTICLDKKTFVYSDPEKTWRKYYRQKTRHLTTGRHYKLKHKILLGFLSLGHLLHYTGGFVLFLACKTSMIFVILLYVLRLTIVMIMMNRILKRLNEQSLLPYIPFLDVIFLLYYLSFAHKLLFRKHKQWK